MSHPEGSNELPRKLAEFLEDKLFACLTHPTDHGTVLVMKAPAPDIESIRGPLPTEVHHQLYDHVTAPVIRMAVTFYDRPIRPLAFEAFINVGDPQQRSDYAALADQPELHMLFYDEDLSHRLTKSVAHSSRDRVPEILVKAAEIFHAIPDDEFSFEIAKAAVMRRTFL
jgi:hypothetical protein